MKSRSSSIIGSDLAPVLSLRRKSCSVHRYPGLVLLFNCVNHFLINTVTPDLVLPQLEGHGVRDAVRCLSLSGSRLVANFSLDVVTFTGFNCSVSGLVLILATTSPTQPD
ncbi:hypothetical protein RRG08_058986 [Elysia crispata]|uniref:Uncharacterized protein n=1 Tax=Elysia crispata TaxID=231223 RepID=A0AAE1AZM5_9GAST|nr:hypothetical protein RRG08_058986 [Elysia crispata]